MPYEDPLDPEQLAAVEANDRAIAVLAGPGSGKTRVLSYRARLLLTRDKNSNCLLLTFTNKAAAEMKSRAMALSPVLSKRIWASNFHNFALSVLRSHGMHVGIAPDFDVLDDAEREELAARAAQGADCANHGKAWSSQRLRQQLPTAEVTKFRDAFEALKRKEGVVDFDDLIVYVVQLFQQKPDIAKAYAAYYQHILIDEFQDTNAAQFALVRALAEHASAASTIGVFADDDQAIFGFAGAETKNIQRFCDDLQAKVYPLTTNYRCSDEIVKVANRLIKANRANGREMKSQKKGSVVVARVFENMVDEAAVICTEVQKSIASGRAPHSISILVRNAYRADAMKATLAERHIPYSNWLGPSYEAGETRRMRVCLAVVRPLLTNRSCRHLCEMLAIKDVPATPTVNTQEFLLKWKAKAAVKHLLAVRELAEKKQKVSEVVMEVCNCIKAVDPEFADAERLIAEVVAFEAHDPEYSLDQLLADLALGGRTGAPTSGGGVKLATIHRTKGLQWPTVYLVGLDEGHLPDFRTSTNEGLREERRLCFVGVCRAEDNLTITRIRVFKGHLKAPSPFIGELGVSEKAG